jgi:hypothetical protein
MPTLLPNDEVTEADLQGYRIFIYAHDHPHPPHVHFRKGSKASAWEFAALTCRDKGGFSAAELKVQRKLFTKYHDAIWRAWHDHWQRQPDNEP